MLICCFVFDFFGVFLKLCFSRAPSQHHHHHQPPYSPTQHHGRIGPLAGHVVSRSVAVTTRMSDTRHLAPLSSPRVSTQNLFARRSPGARPLAWPAGDDRRRYRRYERNGPPQWNPQMTKLRTSYTARGACIGTCKSTWSPSPTHTRPRTLSAGVAPGCSGRRWWRWLALESNSCCRINLENWKLLVG